MQLVFAPQMHTWHQICYCRMSKKNLSNLFVAELGTAIAALIFFNW
jgi:hypothetical protein